MPTLHFPAAPPALGVHTIASPNNAPLRFLRVQSIRLAAAAPEHIWETGREEQVLDILAGVCSLNVSSPHASASFPEIGARPSVFAGRPTMAYLPPGARVSLFAESPLLEAILISAPSACKSPPVVVFPEEATVRTVGKDNWQRTMVTSIGENVAAERLLVGETTNPPGNWSSAPPHKHDRAQDGEIPMEEVYLYRLNPPQGFGLQRIYTPPGDPDPLDTTIAVRDGDLVAIPRGYHPVVAAPGYQLFYLWALAGDQRRYGAWTDDPDHAWIKGVG